MCHGEFKAGKKNKEFRTEGGFAILDRLTREGLIKKVTSEEAF